jgi:four helix bundle protein
MKKSYQDLDVYKTSFMLAVNVHKISFELPKYEIYELGSQVRRSAQSIRANIVEGYGRRRYLNEFIKFLIYADGSLQETESHLNMIYELYHIQGTKEIIEKYNHLGKQLNRFIKYVETKWRN